MSSEENQDDTNTQPEEIDLDAAKEAMDAMANPEIQALLAEIRARGTTSGDSDAATSSATTTALAILASNLVNNTSRSSNTIVQLAEKQKHLAFSTSGILFVFCGSGSAFGGFRSVISFY